jgi:hypothetical protein
VNALLGVQTPFRQALQGIIRHGDRHCRRGAPLASTLQGRHRASRPYRRRELAAHQVARMIRPPPLTRQPLTDRAVHGTHGRDGYVEGCVSSTPHAANAPQGPPDEAGWLHLLTYGEVLDCKPLPWGSNYTFALVLADDEHEGLAIYKPRRGEVPLWDFPDGTLYRREYAAFVLSRLLGWDFIPPIVVRDGPYGIGTMQRYIEPTVPYRQLGPEDDAALWRIAVFDLVANNADRKSAHCFKGIDGRVWGIDHGLTFHTVPKLRTVLWEFSRRPIPAPLLDDLARLASRDDEVRAALGPWLDAAEIEALFRRIGRLLAQQRFPQLDPRRNVPYEFW